MQHAVLRRVNELIVTCTTTIKLIKSGRYSIRIRGGAVCMNNVGVVRYLESCMKEGGEQRVRGCQEATTPPEIATLPSPPTRNALVSSHVRRS